MDPFNGFGQFCDRGPSYYPAIFYETEEEMEVVENVLTEILDLKGWSIEDIAARIDAAAIIADKPAAAKGSRPNGHALGGGGR